MSFKWMLVDEYEYQLVCYSVYKSLLIVSWRVKQLPDPNHLIPYSNHDTNPVENPEAVALFEKCEGAVDVVAFLTITPWPKSLVFWHGRTTAVAEILKQ